MAGSSSGLLGLLYRGYKGLGLRFAYRSLNVGQSVFSSAPSIWDRINRGKVA